MEGGNLQPYAEGLQDYGAPELAIVVLFVVVSGMLALLLLRHVLALVRSVREASRKPPSGE